MPEPEPPRVPATARHYAQAIFELAQQEGDLHRWQVRLDQVRRLFQDTDLGAVVSAPLLSLAEKEELCREVLAHEPEIDKEAGNLLQLLVNTRRERMVPAIEEGYRELVDRAEHRIQATLTTAVGLDPAELGRLAEQLSQRLGLEVRLRTQTDPDVLGGAVLRLGDRVYDGSLRGRLEQLRQRMLSATA